MAALPAVLLPGAQAAALRGAQAALLTGAQAALPQAALLTGAQAAALTGAHAAALTGAQAGLLPARQRLWRRISPRPRLLLRPPLALEACAPERALPPARLPRLEAAAVALTAEAMKAVALTAVASAGASPNESAAPSAAMAGRAETPEEREAQPALLVLLEEEEGHSAALQGDEAALLSVDPESAFPAEGQEADLQVRQEADPPVDQEELSAGLWVFRLGALRKAGAGHRSLRAHDVRADG